jgi:hypothetical protein
VCRPPDRRVYSDRRAAGCARARRAVDRDLIDAGPWLITQGVPYVTGRERLS